ncbi:DNA repair protein rad52 [Gurleya vavrai]
MKNEFTQNEIKSIQLDLEKRLGPELISYRQGYASSKLSYIEGWMAISLANKIFGFNGWSSKIKKINLDYEEKTERGFNIGISVICQIKLKDGTRKEDVGFGSADNQKNRGMAYEKAKKEAATDALKRAFRQFGNALGNCLYDKEFLKDIQRVEKMGSKFEIDKLYRMQDVKGKNKRNDYDFTISDDDFKNK